MPREASFDIIPAIDLKGGRCVRLEEGRADRVTEYGDDPLAMALHWQEQGATRLHLVDLDGAFSGDAAHEETARAIFASLYIPVQFGGGLRELDLAERMLRLGASRVIIGTAAVENPDMVEEAVRRHGERIVVGIDARDGLVAVRGWREASTVTARELAGRMKDLGVTRLIYTDVARDGMMRGPNVEATAALAAESGLRIIASGGVRDVGDILELWRRRKRGIEGVVLGRALYEKKVDLREAERTVRDAAGAEAGA